MWWVPMTTAAGVGIVILLLHYWQQRYQLRYAHTYRARFVQLIAQLDTVTGAVNDLASEVRLIKDSKLLDYYEGTLRILETLLTAVRRIPPFGQDASVLDSAFFLVRDCRQRVGRVQQAFQDTLRGRPVHLSALYGASERSAALVASGCYFCSRPAVASRFTKVKVRIDGAVKEVVSCRICKEELETTKKIKVLYFMKDGKPVHWTEISDYQPSEDFWNINKREPIHKTRRLELVYTKSEPEPLS